MSLQTLQEKVRSIATQLLSDQLNIWNAASGGALVMGSNVQTKDLIEQLSWGLISGLVSERNAFAPAGTAANLKVMAQLLANQVRLDGKVGPLVITSGMLDKLNSNVGEISSVVSAQAAQGMIDSMVKVGISAAKAAIDSGAYTNLSPVTTQPARPVTGITPIGAKFPTLIDLELATIPFGDRMSDIRAWFMTGAQYIMFKAYDVIQNDKELFKIDTVRIMEDASGRRFVVSDAPTATDSVLGLTAGGVVVNMGALSMASDTKLGGENIEYILQGEFSYDLAIKGYKLKSSVTGTAGTQSFKQATLTTSANWEAIANAGVDQAPINFDNYEGETIPTEANPAKKYQQDEQTQAPFNVKETAGVLLKLTATVDSGS